MARPLRIEYEHAFYHVISRGERRETIFKNDRDRDRFLEKLAETVEKYQLVIHGYVLMGNHYHLLVETPNANLSKAMHYLNASYANWFRWRHHILGSVFQSRYKAVLVDRDEYLKTLSAYIHLNPLRARIVKKALAYPYISLSYYLEKKKPPVFLHTEEILELCGGKKGYRELIKNFMPAGAGIAREDVYGVNSILGGTNFIKKAFVKAGKSGMEFDDREETGVREAKQIEADDIYEILLADMRIAENELESRRRGNVFRKLLVYGLWRYTDLSLKEMGELLKMDYGAVSELARKFAREMIENKQYARLAKVLDRHVNERRILKSR